MRSRCTNPASVTLVPLRASSFSCVSPLRLSSPMSVSAVPFRDKFRSWPKPLRCSSPASVAWVPTKSTTATSARISTSSKFRSHASSGGSSFGSRRPSASTCQSYTTYPPNFSIFPTASLCVVAQILCLGLRQRLVRFKQLLLQPLDILLGVGVSLSMPSCVPKNRARIRSVSSLPARRSVRLVAASASFSIFCNCWIWPWMSLARFARASSSRVGAMACRMPKSPTNRLLLRPANPRCASRWHRGSS